MRLTYLGSSAVLDGPYRYLLSRTWDDARPRVAFVMLNPSTADAAIDDPTIRRCVGFAHRWGGGRLDVVNLYAHRSTYPSELPAVADPEGDPRNLATILDVARKAELVVAAWGSLAGLFRMKAAERAARVATALAPIAPGLHVLGLCGNGQPRHPLYAPSALKPKAWIR